MNDTQVPWLNPDEGRPDTKGAKRIPDEIPPTSPPEELRQHMSDDDDIPSRRGVRDVSETYVPKAEPQRRLPVMITLDGRRISERFVLGGDRSVLGRDVRADIIISDGEVSRRHAEIEWTNYDPKGVEDPVCLLRDMGSTNGTFLNNEKIGRVAALRDGDQVRIGKTVLGFFLKDERVLELDQLLLSMALHDSLTGVYKRDYFFTELHREFERSRRHSRALSLLMLDIDRFKSVNDECGHLCGDEALRQFAHVVRLSLREGDICGRYGGEEFAILLPETDLEGARYAGERIRKNVSAHPFDLGKNHMRHITTSVGVATLVPECEDKMQLVDAADRALLRAKTQGRNRVIAFEDNWDAGETDSKTRVRVEQ